MKTTFTCALLFAAAALTSRAADHQDEKPRLYIGPEWAAVLTAFEKGCPAVQITADVDRADFAVKVSNQVGLRYVGITVIPHTTTNFAVFNKSGDLVASASKKGKLGNAVKDACAAIQGTK